MCDVSVVLKYELFLKYFIFCCFVQSTVLAFFKERDCTIWKYYSIEGEGSTWLNRLACTVFSAVLHLVCSRDILRTANGANP